MVGGWWEDGGRMVSCGNHGHGELWQRCFDATYFREVYADMQKHEFYFTHTSRKPIPNTHLE